MYDFIWFDLTWSPTLNPLCFRENLRNSWCIAYLFRTNNGSQLADICECWRTDRLRTEHYQPRQSTSLSPLHTCTSGRQSHACVNAALTIQQPMAQRLHQFGPEKQRYRLPNQAVSYRKAQKHHHVFAILQNTVTKRWIYLLGPVASFSKTAVLFYFIFPSSYLSLLSRFHVFYVMYSSFLCLYLYRSYYHCVMLGLEVCVNWTMIFYKDTCKCIFCLGAPACLNVFLFFQANKMIDWLIDYVSSHVFLLQYKR